MDGLYAFRNVMRGNRHHESRGGLTPNTLTAVISGLYRSVLRCLVIPSSSSDTQLPDTTAFGNHDNSAATKHISARRVRFVVVSYSLDDWCVELDVAMSRAIPPSGSCRTCTARCHRPTHRPTFSMRRKHSLVIFVGPNQPVQWSNHTCKRVKGRFKEGCRRARTATCSRPPTIVSRLSTTSPFSLRFPLDFFSCPLQRVSSFIFRFLYAHPILF